MQVGTETNSLVNHIYSRTASLEPVVGMGVTLLHWTDRSAGTIFRIFTVGKSAYIEVREDHCKRIDKNGMSEDQQYEYKTDVKGSRQVFKRQDNGRWVRVRKSETTGRWVKAEGCGLLIGQRRAYHDFSF